MPVQHRDAQTAITQKVSAPPLPSLTGIRGVAALWVVLYHVCDLYWPRVPIVRDGFRAVDLFFILSGFIMMHVHRDDFPSIRWDNSARFLGLRVIRIYPLSTVVLLLIAPYVLAHPAFVAFIRHSGADASKSFSGVGFFQTLLLANRWFLPDLGNWNGPTWSLSVELVAYLTFPVVAFLLARQTSVERCLTYAVSVLALLVAYLIATGRAEINAIGMNGIVRGVAGFISGAAMYRFCRLCAQSETNRKRAALCALISCALLLALMLAPHMAVFSPFCFLALIGALYFQRGVINTFLAGKLCVFLGAISFSLYLIHYVPLQVLHWLLSSGRLDNQGSPLHAEVAVYLSAVFLLAWLLHVCVERPAHKLGRRLIRRKPKSLATSQ